MGQSIANPNNEGVVWRSSSAKARRRPAIRVRAVWSSDAVSQHLDEIGQMISSLNVVPVTEESA